MSFLGLKKGGSRAVAEQASAARLLSPELMEALSGLPQLPEPGDDDRRANTRICVGTRAMLCAANSVGEPVAVVLRDLSSSGVGMLVDAELPVGAECWIYIPKANAPDDYVGLTCEIIRCDRGGFELSAYVAAAVFLEGEPPELMLPSEEEEARQPLKPAKKQPQPVARPNSAIFSATPATEAGTPEKEDHSISEQLSEFFSEIAPEAKAKQARQPEIEPMPVVKEIPLPALEPQTPQPVVVAEVPAAVQPRVEIEKPAPVISPEPQAAPVVASVIAPPVAPIMAPPATPVVAPIVVPVAAPVVATPVSSPAPVPAASHIFSETQSSSTAQPLSEAVVPASASTEAAAQGEKLSWSHIRRMAKKTDSQMGYLTRLGNRLDEKHARTNPALRQDVEKARKALEVLNARLNSLRNPEAEEVAQKCVRRAAKRRAKNRAHSAKDNNGQNGAAPHNGDGHSIN